MSPNPLLRYRKHEKEIESAHTDTKTICGSSVLTPGTKIVSPTSSSTFMSTTHSSTTKSLAASKSPRASLKIVRENDIETRDGTQHTALTATQSSAPYKTLISSSTSNCPTPFSQPQFQPQTQKSASIKIKNPPIPNPRLSKGTIAGLAVGIVVGVILLTGVAYVYYLRARDLKREKEKRRRRKRRKSTGSGGAAPAPPPPPADGAFPPANP
ncbi:hypothetical protein VTL71DRAFT_335 [Oculimacula yallundae]|uniref:Uncharacterized protein n=1 Tax=Oculimacula yallundae TaxID=86028 RepID=A0ABR4D0P7_9HELO